MDLREKNKLLHARAGFGISLEDYEHPLPIPEAVDRLFPKDKPEPLEIITQEEWAKYSPGTMLNMAPDMRRDKQQVFMGRMKDINQLWQSSMISSPYPLQEKMTLFWHGHFATKLDNPYYDQKLLNILRRNALGNFGTLLREISKNEVMVQFLNNKQNVKDHPNENFSREVMELFTLGRDNYTEHDVKEAGRAFTGWSLDANGVFLLRDDVHDDGEKQFLGKTGKFNGDDILNMLLEQKQTAVYVTQKIYRFFVSDENMDEQRIAVLADHFFKNNFDISALLKVLFTADWFYGEDVQCAKIKSPMELLVGFQRMVPVQLSNDRNFVKLQRLLGQHLFNPPNVAGWPGGKNWIDSFSLVMRMKLPSALYMSNDAGSQHIAHLGEIDDFPLDAQLRLGVVNADWSKYLAYWKKQPKEQLPRAIAAYLLHAPLTDEELKAIAVNADKSSDDAYIKSMTVLLMQVPEYQLA